MALERKKILSAITIHFATDDIKDENDVVIIPVGSMKKALVEFTTFISEDNVPIDGTYRRETATVADMDSVPEIKDKKLDTIARLTARVQDQEKALRVERDRAEKAELRATKAEARSKPADPVE